MRSWIRFTKLNWRSMLAVGVAFTILMSGMALMAAPHVPSTHNSECSAVSRYRDRDVAP